MNVYVMVDMEGISGITRREQVMPGEARYSEGQTLLVREINVCVEALKEAGVGRVYVRDCHSAGFNVRWEELSSSADVYIVGSTGSVRFPGLDDCDAVILLGYHAMAGTAGGTLEHSMSSVRIQNYWINGEPAGETAIDAGIAGDHGKPVIMVSGDDKVCAEAEALMPWVVTAEVKKGITWNGGMLLPPQKAYGLIRQRTIEAVQKAGNAQPLCFEKPVRLRVEVTERQSLPDPIARPYVRFLDGRTYEVDGATMEEAFFKSN